MHDENEYAEMTVARIVQIAALSRSGRQSNPI